MTDQELRDEAKRAAYEVIRDYLAGNGSKGEEALLAVEFLKMESAIEQIEARAWVPTTAPVPMPR